MKKTIMIMMFILCLPLVYSIYGGETWRYHFNECKELRVNITTTEEIEEGEYTVLNDCEENQTNYYLCDCENDYYFNVTFKVNAVNNYTLYFNYDYERYVEETGSGGSSSGGGGGGGGSTYYKFTGKSVSKVFYMTQNVYSRFNIKGITHKIIVTEIGKEQGKEYVIVEIHSNITRVRLDMDKEFQIDLDKDNKYDLSLTLIDIRGRTALIEIKEIKIKVPEDNETTPIEPTEEIDFEDYEEAEIIEEQEKEKETRILPYVIIGIVVLIIILIIYLIARKKE